jgi:hypothetical protein
VSNVGQAALIVVGTVVGTYFGYPQLGFVLGSLAGSALFPTQLPPGPKIQDNRTTTSTVGGPISLVFGTANVGGTVMWLAPYVQSSSEQSGKGGPEQQTFSYTQSIAIGLAERVDDDADDSIGAIAGLSRIWENGAIVYDIRPQQVANTFLGTLAETDQEYQNRLTASAAYAETFTLYLGDELQEPDPTIEAIQGVGQVPPFRGLAYIVYPNRALTIAQGLRHPNFQFEVFQAGVGDCVSSTVYSNNILYRWQSGTEADPTNPQNINTFAPHSFDANLVTQDGKHYLDYPSLNFQFDSLDDLLASVSPYYKMPLSYVGYASDATAGGTSTEVIRLSSSIGDGAMGIPTPGDYITSQQNVVWVYFNVLVPQDGYYSESRITPPYFFPEIAPTNKTWHGGDGGPNRVIQSLSYTWPSTPESSFPPYPAPYTGAIVNSATGPSSAYCFFIYDVQIIVRRFPSPPPNPCLGLTPSPTIPGYAIMENGDLIQCNDWQLVPGPYGFSWKTMSVFNENALVNAYPWNPTLPVTDPNYDNETFWTNAYNALVAEQKMPSGLTYGIDYPITPTAVYQLDRVICTGSGIGVSIGDICRAICKRSGLLAIDASDMDAISVDGYAISSVCTGSSILSPLRSIGFFDAVETDGLIKFQARGKPVAATFTTDDFGAYDGAQSTSDSSGASSCPPSLTVARSQDEDLPRSIRFHYIATSRDYEDAEQDSSFRLATAAVNDVDITVPVCLPDTQAAQCASVLWADSWAARTSYELSIDQSKLILDVGDCIAVPVDGFIRRMRIASDTNSSAVLRKLSCVQDDEGAYISFAVSTPPQRQPQQLSFIGATVYELLDLPCLQDADSDPGFYVACQRVGGMWKGATFYKSNDGGASWATLFSLLSETTMGTILNAVPASQALTWDDSTQIIVNVPSSSYSFESVSDDALLAGANAACMGSDGRWEIIQFANAAQATPTQWILSRLLRGRRGTEHVLGSSRAGDQFVMVSDGTIGRVVLQASEIGAARTYRGTSVGASFSSGVIETFTGHGQALVCFSPVDVKAQRITDGDIVISWFRRSRLGRTLMSGVDIPLGETIESFSVDILSPDSPSSPEIVLRTLNVTNAEQVLYTVAMQEIDFGSTPISSLKCAVYQLSSIVGRGTPALVTLTLESG